MYRMRRWPAPFSVTSPPPSSTTIGEVLTTFAVVVITMVTGSGPQLKVMTPPSATASTTACDVQLAGTWSARWGEQAGGDRVGNCRALDLGDAGRVGLGRRHDHADQRFQRQDTPKLELLDQRRFANGVVYLRYHTIV